MERLNNLSIGPTEILYLFGVALLFAGLTFWMGVDIALTICGAVVVLTALLNSWMQHQEAMKAMNHGLV